MDFVSVEIEWSDGLVEWLSKDGLPLNWFKTESSAALKEIGDQWFREKRSLVLAVPSAVTRNEHNFLINPEHPDFSAICLSPAEPFEFDRRFFVNEELLKVP